MDADFAKRVWAHVQRGAPDACWPWTGSVFNSGYGRVNLPREGGKKRATTAHRVIWTLLYGKPHEALEICHTCDNRPCCNPSHLFAGTTKINAVDKMRKGRVARMNGQLNGSCKITPSDVVEIRASSVAHAVLARKYGISESNVRMIRTRETWRHV